MIIKQVKVIQKDYDALIETLVLNFCLLEDGILENGFNKLTSTIVECLIGVRNSY